MVMKMPPARPLRSRTVLWTVAGVAGALGVAGAVCLAIGGRGFGESAADEGKPALVHAIPAPPAQPNLPPGTPYSAAVGLPGALDPNQIPLPPLDLLSNGSVVEP